MFKVKKWHKTFEDDKSTWEVTIKFSPLKTVIALAVIVLVTFLIRKVI